MSDEEIILHLTRTFTSLKTVQPSISLRMWYNEGKLQYFFTNLPPRNSRNRPANPRMKCGDDQPDDVEPPPPPVMGGGDDLSSVGPPPRQVERSPSPLPIKQRGKGRKRKCMAVSTPASTPEILRTTSTPPAHQTSTIEEDRNVSVVSIPVSNSFELLSSLDDDARMNVRVSQCTNASGAVVSYSH